RQSVAVIKILTSHQRWHVPEGSEKLQAYRVLETLLKDSEVQQFLQVNRYQDVLWFSHEAFAQLLWWLWLAGVVPAGAEPAPLPEATTALLESYRILQDLRQAGLESEYRVERLLTAAKDRSRPVESDMDRVERHGGIS